MEKQEINEKDDRCIEFEMGKHNHKFYLLVSPFLNPPEIWVDTRFLPDMGTICALIDGTPMFTLKVGKKHNLERMFVDIEWIINKWGGSEKIVTACTKRRDNFLGRMEEFRKHLDEKSVGDEFTIEAGKIE